MSPSSDTVLERHPLPLFDRCPEGEKDVCEVLRFREGRREFYRERGSLCPSGTTTTCVCVVSPGRPRSTQTRGSYIGEGVWRRVKIVSSYTFGE